MTGEGNLIAGNDYDGVLVDGCLYITFCIFWTEGFSAHRSYVTQSSLFIKVKKQGVLKMDTPCLILVK